MTAAGSVTEERLRRTGWALLLTLLAAMLAGAAFYDRAGWPGAVAGEATYLMQAESLLEDGDLAYSRADFDRMLLAELGEPTDLALASGSEGRRITFDRPFPYALWLAPFLALSPSHGFALANAVLLALVCVAASLLLGRRLGGAAPLAVTVLVFASVSFAYVFLATGDLFLMALVVLAFALAAAGERSTAAPAQVYGEAGGAPPRRWWLVGALLAVPLATDPLYGLLLLAAFVIAGRGAARANLTAGALIALLVLVGVQWWTGGGLHFIATERFRFTPETGFPLVDFTAAEWSATVHRLAALHWDGAPRLAWGLDLGLWLWNGLYLLLGRSIGLVPYFAPLLLIAGCGSLRGGRKAILAAVAAGLVLLVVLRPFNFYGGEGAVANRLFLPFYGALWWLLDAPARRRSEGVAHSARRAALWAAVAGLVAAPFLWRLWQAPRAHPIDPGTGYRHVTPLARRLLPYETSQRRMPGGEVAEVGGLMVKLLTERAWVETRRGRLVVDGRGPAEMLIGSSLPLDVLRLDFGKQAPSAMQISGGEIGERILLAGGGISFRVLPRGVVRRHPMWWTPQRQRLYLLSFELPTATDQPLAFQLSGERVGEP